MVEFYRSGCCCPCEDGLRLFILWHLPVAVRHLRSVHTTSILNRPIVLSTHTLISFAAFMPQSVRAELPVK
jgi:hypothetical protein